MANKDERERLGIVETKVDQQGKDITEIKGDVKTILGRFDIVLGLRAEIDALKVDLNNQKVANESEIKSLKAAKFRNTVVYPALGFIIGSVLSALVLSVITHKP